MKIHNKTGEVVLEITDLNLYGFDATTIQDELDRIQKLNIALLVARAGCSLEELTTVIGTQGKYFHMPLAGLQAEIISARAIWEEDKTNKVNENKLEEITRLIELKENQSHYDILNAEFEENKETYGEEKQKGIQQTLLQIKVKIDQHQANLESFYLESEIAKIGMKIKFDINEKAEAILKDLREAQKTAFSLICKYFGLDKDIEKKLTPAQMVEIMDAVKAENMDVNTDGGLGKFIG